MEIIEKILQTPGFIYKIDNSYYYLGKWICKECTDTDATDCHSMYEMYQNAGEENELALYFNKIRTYSDFALDIPHNPVLIRKNLEDLITKLTDDTLDKLALQLDCVQKDHGRYSL